MAGKRLSSVLVSLAASMAIAAAVDCKLVEIFAAILEAREDGTPTEGIAQLSKQSCA